MGSTALANAPLANATDIAPYFFEHRFNSSDTTEAALSSLMSMNDEQPPIAKLQQSTTPSHKDIDVYEVNLSTISGDAPDSERDPLVAGMASGTALANRIITAMKRGRPPPERLRARAVPGQDAGGPDKAVGDRARSRYQARFPADRIGCPDA